MSLNQEPNMVVFGSGLASLDPSKSLVLFHNVVKTENDQDMTPIRARASRSSCRSDSRAAKTRQCRRRQARQVSFKTDNDKETDMSSLNSRLASVDLNDHTRKDDQHGIVTHPIPDYQPEETRRRKLPGGKVVIERDTSKEDDLAEFNTRLASLNLDGNRALSASVGIGRHKGPDGGGVNQSASNKADGMVSFNSLPASRDLDSHIPESDSEVEEESDLDTIDSDDEQVYYEIAQEIQVLRDDLEECLMSWRDCLARIVHNMRNQDLDRSQCRRQLRRLLECSRAIDRLGERYWRPVPKKRK